MVDNAAFNLNRLLAPIAENDITGIDCRHCSPPCRDYWAVRDARNRARAAERKNLFEQEKQDVTGLWREVASTGELILTTQSKDLEVACWLAEALVRLRGFAGLRDAFGLLRAMVNRYWDRLHPNADEEGMEIRMMPLAGLNGDSKEGVLLAAIRTCPLTGDANGQGFSYWHYQQALEADRLEHERQQIKIAKMGYSLADVQQSVADSDPATIAQLRADIAACRDDYLNLNKALEDLCGTESAPPSSAIVNLLGECLDAVDHLTGGKYANPPDAAEAAIMPEVQTLSPAQHAPCPTALTHELKRLAEQWRFAAPESSVPFLLEQILESGDDGAQPIARRQAFTQLASIANYFRAREPHSPIPYLLDRVQRWGAMPLANLIEELIPNEAAFEHFSILTGVTKEANQSTHNGG